MQDRQLEMFDSSEQSEDGGNHGQKSSEGLERVINLSNYFEGGFASNMQRPGVQIEGSSIDATGRSPTHVARKLSSDRGWDERRFITHTTPSGYNEKTDASLNPYFFGQPYDRVTVQDQSQVRAYTFEQSKGVRPARMKEMRQCLKPYSAEVVKTTISPEQDYFMDVQEDDNLYRVSQLEASNGESRDNVSALAEYHDEIEPLISDRLSKIVHGSDKNIAGAFVGEPYRRDKWRLKETKRQVLAPAFYVFGGSAPE